MADRAAALAIIEDAEQAAAELARRRFERFLSAVRIRSDDPQRPQAMALDPYPYQRALGELLEARQSCIILKRRQAGASTLLGAYALWRAIQGWEIGYYSRGQAEAQRWLDGLQAMAHALPHALRPPAMRRSGDILRMGSGGSIRAFAGTENAGISYTFQLIIADEGGHHRYGRENYANYAPAIGAGGQFILASTADPASGRAGWFYEMWRDASEAGYLHLSADSAIEMPGTGAPGPYRAVFVDRWARPDQGAEWWAGEQARYAGQGHALAANYPQIPEEAFQGRAGLVYGVDALTSEPIFDLERNVRRPAIAWEECRWRVWAGDPGGSDPSAIVAMGIWPDDHVHIYGLMHRRGPCGASTWSEYLARLHHRAQLARGWCDPSQGALIATLNTLGWPTYPAINDKGPGIAAVSEMLVRGWLTISPECEQLIHEFGTYWWRERRDGEAGGSGRAAETTTPGSHHADCLDALRYAVMGTRPHLRHAGSGASVALPVASGGIPMLYRDPAPLPEDLI